MRATKPSNGGDASEIDAHDPAHDFIRYDHENYGLLSLTPWRIDLVSFPAPSFEEGTKVWRREGVAVGE